MLKTIVLATLCSIGSYVFALPLELAPHGPKYGDQTFKSFYNGGENLTLPLKIFLGRTGYTQAWVSIV